MVWNQVLSHLDLWMVVCWIDSKVFHVQVQVSREQRGQFVGDSSIDDEPSH